MEHRRVDNVEENVYLLISKYSIDIIVITQRKYYTSCEVNKVLIHGYQAALL